VTDPIAAMPSRGPAVVFRAPREWTRMHPVSPLLGGWAVLGVAIAIVAYNRLPSWTGPDEATQDLARWATRSIFWFALGVAVVMAVTLGLGYLQWRFNMYRLGDEAIHQRKGVVFRQQRQARLDRLQAVDVVQPLVARIFGFASLKIEVAGGENSGISLEYMRLGDAEAVRNELLALAAGVKRAKEVGADSSVTAVAQALTGNATTSTATTADAPAHGAPALAGAAGDGAGGAAGERAGDGADGAAHEGESASAASTAYAPGGSLRDLAGMPAGVAETPAAQQRTVYTVPLGRLLASIALSWPTMWLVAIPVLAVIAVLLLSVDLWRLAALTFGTSLFTVVPALFAMLGFFWTRLSGGFGFTASLSEDGIGLRHGLTETRRQTVPPGRVQAVRFEQSLLWRRKDWWRVTINVAGYQENQESVSTLLPVGTREDALTALWLVLPDLGDPDPAGTVSLALSGTGDEGGFTASPQRARIFDPFQWRQRGVRATDRALMIRRGRLVREVFVVPHERTQSLGLTQGPWQRRRGLATFTVHSTNGPVKPVAQHLDIADALALLDAQAGRAAEGRRRQSPEQWLAAVGIRD
jgi:putative membrane protein